ncbi:hypothetical protein J1N35_037792 [Gossypium stocksii]|uniref:Pentatricopeptide repeat-containing protein n=1 Tax=Gossypium stocksii TaxID=47602 RepID=A0A9D3UKP9_9ROSI|nr:hypothetical protein J1N35_037792 [Gossypium stocksii]
MIQRYPKPSIVEFTKLLAAIVRMKHYAIALSMCSQMELLRVSWDVYSLSILVSCFCQLGQLDLGFSVLGNMLKLGFEPHVTFSTLMHGWEDLQGIEPDVVTYSILVDAYCKEGMVSEANDVVGTMIKQGIEPDVVTYNILVDVHCREGMVSEAEDIVQ